MFCCPEIGEIDAVFFTPPISFKLLCAGLLAFVLLWCFILTSGHCWEADAEHFTLNLCMTQLCSFLSGELLQLETVTTVFCNRRLATLDLPDLFF